MPWYLEALLSIPLGLLLGNFTEWWFHRFVLHGLGKKPGKLWSFHFHAPRLGGPTSAQALRSPHGPQPACQLVCPKPWFDGVLS